MGTGKQLGGIVAVIVALAALLAVRAAFDSESPTDLVVVGDSFPEQARDQLIALAEEQNVSAEVDAFGGTSICGWWGRLEEHAAAEPDVLVIAFAGNDMQPCITDDPEQQREPDVVAADYRDDLETVLEMFEDTNTRVYVVLPPPVGLDVFEVRAAAMRQMYRDTHRDHPNLGLIDSATHLDPDGRGFQPTLPCEPWDSCDEGEEVRVRDDDAIHLTPAGGERYARSILEAIGPDDAP